MRKLLIAVFLIGALAAPSSAGPWHWIKTHKRFLAMEGAAIGGASIHAAGLHHCRHHAGVERCDEHYGEAWASFGLVSGMTVIVAPSLAESCWKNDSGKYCGLLSYIPSGGQAIWGLHEWSLKPKAEERKTLDLLSVSKK